MRPSPAPPLVWVQARELIKLGATRPSEARFTISYPEGMKHVFNVR